MTTFMPERTSWSMPSLLTTLVGEPCANTAGAVDKTDRPNMADMRTKRTIVPSSQSNDRERCFPIRDRWRRVRTSFHLRKRGTGWGPTILHAANKGQLKRQLQ